MKVMTEIDVIEINDDEILLPYPKIKIESHKEFTKCAVIEFRGQRCTINIREMELALKNAGNNI